jgi:CheY-like chemotaxis protein
MKRVVIVEDNELIVKFYRYVLEHDGYVVSATESGDETLQLAREADTVAIILDISLRSTSVEGRSIDGLELGRMLKADPATQEVPIIIATAHTMAGDRERFLRESGAEAFLRKPVTDPAELTSMIQRLSERRGSRPPGPS